MKYETILRAYAGASVKLSALLTLCSINHVHDLKQAEAHAARRGRQVETFYRSLMARYQMQQLALAVALNEEDENTLQAHDQLTNWSKATDYRLEANPFRMTLRVWRRGWPYEIESVEAHDARLNDCVTRMAKLLAYSEREPQAA